ncbi:MAG: hypothetical protein HY782_05070 [Chloroflexi bacterium]|nr:hypothetical protein [Chloroflexota bacterium]
MNTKTDELKTTTCYLLVGGADGALDVALRASDGKIAELSIASKSGFGGMIWQIVAQMLTGAPLETDALNERIARMAKSGLLPEELNLDPLVKTLVKLGRE